FYSYVSPLVLHSFPTRRSSDLDNVDHAVVDDIAVGFQDAAVDRAQRAVVGDALAEDQRAAIGLHGAAGVHDHDAVDRAAAGERRSEEHTSELQSRSDLVCRLLL